MSFERIPEMPSMGTPRVWPNKEVVCFVTCFFVFSCFLTEGLGFSPIDTRPSEQTSDGLPESSGLMERRFKPSLFRSAEHLFVGGL